tara:strand:- start:86 stop:352 length:267 start_codon:yes stop_codon:yes gene_type:complete
VCPTDAFREGPNFLVIDPDACVDCDLCPAECPVEAIFEEDELPAGQEVFIELNAELSQVWPEISTSKAAPDDHEQWNGVEGKLKLLER